MIEPKLDGNTLRILKAIMLELGQREIVISSERVAEADEFTLLPPQGTESGLIFRITEKQNVRKQSREPAV